MSSDNRVVSDNRVTIVGRSKLAKLPSDVKRAEQNWRYRALDDRQHPSLATDLITNKIAANLAPEPTDINTNTRLIVIE